MQALKTSILRTDQNFASKKLICGTTAVCVLYYPTESQLFLVWVGDSKAMLVKQGCFMEVVKPHSPAVPVSSLYSA